jgi:hypothetical protein
MRFDALSRVWYSLLNSMPRDARFAKALLQFHLSVGARVALRTVAPVVSLFLFFYYVLKPEFSVFLIRVLLFENGLLISGLTLALAVLIASRVAASRVLLSSAGWVRHLPLSSAGHRRLAVFSATLACLPILLILGFLIESASATARRPAILYLAGLPLLGLSSSLFWTPVKRRLPSRLLAFLACSLLGTGQASLFAAGVLSLAAADLVAGPLRRGGRVSLFIPKGKSPGLIQLIALRAIGGKFVPLYLVSFVILILSQLFVLNNRVTGRLASASVRFGGMLGLVVFMALLAGVLSTRRPPWPWVRSLPCSARQRIIADAVFLGVPALSLAAVVSALNIWAGLPVLLSIPLLAVRASALMRRSAELRAGPALAIGLEGGFLAMGLALVPLLSLVLLAAVPFALAGASNLERKLKVSRWTELHHLAAGDSQSWSST